jgi:rhodanese-related sulfurtransferase
MVTPLSAQRLRERLDAGETLTVLDVREPEEIAIARFDGALEIPMQDIPGRVGELDPTAEIVVVCHHGVRSAHVAMFLVDQGFSRVLNLTGGIDAWALEVDRSVPRY